MNSSLQQLLQAFDCVSQPVFFAREGQIIYANAAAQEQLLMPGTPLETLLADAQALRESVGGDGDAMQLPVRLAGGVYNAVTRPMEDGRLFVVRGRVLRAGDRAAGVGVRGA